MITNIDTLIFVDDTAIIVESQEYFKKILEITDETIEG